MKKEINEKTEKKKTNPSGGIFATVKEFSLTERKESVPAILYSRYGKLLLYAAGCLVAAIVSLVAVAGLKIMLFATFMSMAIVFFVLAAAFKVSIDTGRFSRYDGEVTYVKESLSTSGLNLKDRSLKRPAYYHIRTYNGEIYQIPAHKQNAEIPLGSKITFYAPKDAVIMDRNGVHTVSPVWAYEVKDEMILYGE